MKAYIVHIEFDDLQPTVWRQVVLPYGATFRRLHETIQLVNNFDSVFGQDKHLFAFELPDEQLLVTNDSADAGALLPAGQAWTVRNPSRIKIDAFLEKYRELKYTYDFGEDWKLTIRLERIVDDYHFGYPTLLAGAGEAPPEDVGGPDGFRTFLMRYLDVSSIGHRKAVEFAERMNFWLYDPVRINDILKSVKWQKTEWDKIDHVNFEILRDPYRRPGRSG